jgi:hypothetical protein
VKPFSPSSVAPSIALPVNPFVGPPPTPGKVDPASGSEIGQTTRTKMGLELPQMWVKQTVYRLLPLHPWQDLM